MTKMIESANIDVKTVIVNILYWFQKVEERNMNTRRMVENIKRPRSNFRDRKYYLE